MAVDGCGVAGGAGVEVMKCGAVVEMRRRGAAGEERIGREEETESWVSGGCGGKSSSFCWRSSSSGSKEDEMRRRFNARSSIL